MGGPRYKRVGEGGPGPHPHSPARSTLDLHETDFKGYAYLRTRYGRRFFPDSGWEAESPIVQIRSKEKN